MLLKAITFDFWNTLYKLTPDIRISERRIGALRQTLQKMGHELDEVTVRDAVREAWNHTHHRQRHEGIDIAPSGQVDLILETLHIQLDKPAWDQIYKVFTAVLIDLPPVLNEGVLETLPVLARSYKLAVICNTGVTPGTVLREIMKKDQIYDYFQLTVFSDEMTWAKPNPKIFVYTLEQLQVRPTEAAHIGDDSLTDVFGSKQAGMTSIWLATQGNEAVPECDHHISSFKELIELFAPTYNKEAEHGSR